MISRNIEILEGTRDATGRVIRPGDVLVLRGKFMADGKFHVDSPGDIRTLTKKLNIKETA